MLVTQGVDRPHGQHLSRLLLQALSLSTTDGGNAPPYDSTPLSPETLLQHNHFIYHQPPLCKHQQPRPLLLHLLLPVLLLPRHLLMPPESCVVHTHHLSIAHCRRTARPWQLEDKVYLLLLLPVLLVVVGLVEPSTLHQCWWILVQQLHMLWCVFLGSAGVTQRGGFLRYHCRGTAHSHLHGGWVLLVA